jgi:serine/threonine protein kinase
LRPRTVSEAARVDPDQLAAFVAMKHARPFEDLEIDNLTPGERKRIRLPDSVPIQIWAEALLLRSLDHPNICKSVGVVTYRVAELDEDGFGLVLEYVPGGTLLSKLQAGGYSMGTALKWLLDVARALHCLHAVAGIPIVHRDVKPENVLITLDGHAKLTDFGLFRFLKERLAAADPEPTATHLPMGKKALREAITTGKTGSNRYMVRARAHQRPKTLLPAQLTRVTRARPTGARELEA